MTAVDINDVGSVGEGLMRPECVLTTARGDLFVSDSRGGIRHLHAQGGNSLYGRSEIIPNGFALMADGSFLVANLSDAGGVWRIGRDGGVRPHLLEVSGKRLPSVNFVLRDAGDRLWICVSTDRPGDDQYRRNVRDGYIILQDGRGARIVADDLCWTNECRVSADGRYLYVNETFGRRLTRFAIGQGGDLGERTTHATFGPGIYPDGLAEDVDGHFYVVSVVSNAILRVAPDGGVQTVLSDADRHVDVLEALYLEDRLTRPVLYDTIGQKLCNVTSIAFGGPDLCTAYLGSLRGGTLASFRVAVPGVAGAHYYQ